MDAPIRGKELQIQDTNSGWKLVSPARTSVAPPGSRCSPMRGCNCKSRIKLVAGNWFPPPAISWSRPYLVAQNNIPAVANECPITEEPCCQIYILPNLPFHLIMFTSNLSRPSCTIPAADGASITNSRHFVDFVTRRNCVVKFISYPIFHSIS
jgi:hypothetical protein